MDKAMVGVIVDGLVIFLGFVLSKYLSKDWADAVKALLVALQPVVIYLVAKALGVQLLIKAGLMK